MDDDEKLANIKAYFDHMNRGHYQWCQTDGKVSPREYLNKIIDATYEHAQANDIELDDKLHFVVVTRDNGDFERDGQTIAIAGFGQNSCDNASGIAAILNALPWLMSMAEKGIQSCRKSPMISSVNTSKIGFVPHSRGS